MSNQLSTEQLCSDQPPDTASLHLPISACIITYNEIDRIGDCLDSLSFCDDIVVIDSGSTDGTAELAQTKGARVLVRRFDGYRTQKDFAVQQAAHDWVLCLDADERITEPLRDEILAERDRGFPAAGYKFPRLSDYFGKFMRHGNAYPDRCLRLFDRRCGAWGGREIHESVRVKGEVRRLRGDMLHYPYRSLSHQLNKIDGYARLMAEEMHAEGKRARLSAMVLSPFWRFLRGYVLRLGFLDGWRGLIYAYVRANYVRQKAIKLWLLERGYRL